MLSITEIDKIFKDKNISKSRPKLYRRQSWEPKQICMIDPNHIEYINKTTGFPKWFRYKNGWICNKCYQRFVTYPKRPKGWWKKYHKNKTPEQNKILTDRTIVFLGKSIILSFIPRTGYCSWCSNNKFDGSCKITIMHHWFYLPIMVWACTEEVCNYCHNQEHERLRKHS